MNVNQKFKIVDNKIEQDKAQFSLDRPTTKITTLS